MSTNSMQIARHIAPPFDAFFNADDVARYARSLAERWPDLCKVSSLGTSAQGREITLLTLCDCSERSARDKPGYLLHGCIHADEISGANMALDHARRLLAEHDAQVTDPHDPRSMLRRMTFYIIPMLNPDGATLAADQSISIRSRFDLENLAPNTLIQQDVDGDGLIVRMRQQHPDGDHMQDPDEPRLVIPRLPGAKGPFYRIWPEGMIHDFDGNIRDIRMPRGLDWNRQWPYDWQPETTQRGSGDYPFSEPEMQHLGRFIVSHRNIISMLGYHTGPASILHPPSGGSVRDMVWADHEIYGEIACAGAALTGYPEYPMVNCRPSHKSPVSFHGHSLSWGYYHMGMLAFEIELGDLFDSAGFNRKDVDACRNDHERIALLRQVMKWWDGQSQETREPLWVDWKPFDHPQLGKVEVGGLLVRNLYNRSLRDLGTQAEGLHGFVLKHASYAPWPVIEQQEVKALGAGITRIRITLANRGSLATSVTARGRSLKRADPVSASLRLAHGVELVSTKGHIPLGHLEAVTGLADMEWFVRTSRSDLKSLGQVIIHAGIAGKLEVDLSIRK